MNELINMVTIEQLRMLVVLAIIGMVTASTVISLVCHVIVGKLVNLILGKRTEREGLKMGREAR